ncbi:hypothetical protein [Microbacterium sp. MYb62]|uniref:hypothetical protein n=1 Tax=Microbacterium sp. MYb62 TaxID=1848690 RepID=UPI000CFD95E5|nr:hypothetical protein [Microbacterium sp. MYb62]PRB14771.1 hypothetical protein CQ042_10175 [Microbacterium sp. MYb62]
MSAISTLTDRNAVEDALDEFDRIGRFAFLERYGFGEAKEYFLVTETGNYDSKAVFAAAYERQFGTRLTPDDFSGGKQGAARWLSDLGYAIEGLDSKEGRLTFDSFEAALNAFRLAVENINAARDFVASRNFVTFYLPPSRQYIAMIPRGGSRPTAWINKGYVWFKNDDGTQDGIAFPYNKLRDGGRNSRQRRREEAERRICPTPGCGMVLPPNGVCDYC